MQVHRDGTNGEGDERSDWWVEMSECRVYIPFDTPLVCALHSIKRVRT